MDAQKYQYLYLKNMTSSKCIPVVTEQAINAGLQIKSVCLGSLVLSKKCTKEQLRQFRNGVEQKGYLLVTGKRERMVEAIKTEIINMVHYDHKLPGNQNFSSYLSLLLGKDYSYLSSLFASSEKTTIEKFIMVQKVEKTKKLLSEELLSLREIAQKLGYSNTQHLSSQFKKITGMSPSEYKKSLPAPPAPEASAEITGAPADHSLSI